jgi:hypothetical protein
MKEVLFENEVFDEDVYNKTKRHYTEMVEPLPQYLQSFRDEGLPTSMDFYLTITESNESLHEEINKRMYDYINGKFIPVDERIRIIQSYGDVEDRLRESFNKLRRMRIERVPLIAEGDTIVPNYDAIDDLARKAATVHINVKKLTDYYNAVKKVVDAIDELREYQTKNGLPDVITGELYRKNGNYINRYSLDLLMKDGFTPEKFADAARDHVQLKK